MSNIDIMISPSNVHVGGACLQRHSFTTLFYDNTVILHTVVASGSQETDMSNCPINIDV